MRIGAVSGNEVPVITPSFSGNSAAPPAVSGGGSYDRLEFAGLPGAAVPKASLADAMQAELQYAQNVVFGGGARGLSGAGRVECQTCANRRYQDESDDASVSFQTPTKLNPNTAASAVMSHEMEHVSHEKADAAEEDKDILHQSVTLRYGICPECGKTYIAGGETRTVTKARPKREDGGEDESVGAAG